MALAAMLSALRTLILDLRELPSEAEARRALYAHIFPELSAPEVDDLVKIDPQKLGIYSTSIFTGEGKLLEAKLPMTWEALRRCWETCFHERPTYQQMARRLHALHPWRSNRTEDLVEGALEFIGTNIPLSDWRRLEIVALANLERDRFYAARRIPNLPSICLPLEELTKLTVSELLAARCFIPSTTLLSEFDYAVLKARDAFRHNKEFLPLIPMHTCVVTSRATDNSVHCTEVPAPVLALLQRVGANAYVSVEDLAITFTATLGGDQNESQQFAQFFDFLLTLIEQGGLFLAPGSLSTSVDCSSQPQP